MSQPIWEHVQGRIDRANMDRFVQFVRFVREQTDNEDIQRYQPLYEFSIRQPEKFWPLVWGFCGICVSGDFEPVLENPEEMPGARFYPNVKLNFARNLLRHRDDKPAIIFRNEWATNASTATPSCTSKSYVSRTRSRMPASKPAIRGWLPAQHARNRLRHAGHRLSGRSMVLVLAGLRHQRRGRRSQGDLGFEFRRMGASLPSHGFSPERLAHHGGRHLSSSNGCPIDGVQL